MSTAAGYQQVGDDTAEAQQEAEPSNGGRNHNLLHPARMPAASPYAEPHGTQLEAPQQPQGNLLPAQRPFSGASSSAAGHLQDEDLAAHSAMQPSAQLDRPSSAVAMRRPAHDGMMPSSAASGMPAAGCQTVPPGSVLVSLPSGGRSAVAAFLGRLSPEERRILLSGLPREQLQRLLSSSAIRATAKHRT